MVQSVYREVVRPFGLRAWKVVGSLLAVTASVAEIASFWIEHQSYVATNFTRFTQHIQIAWSDEPSGSTLQGIEPETRGFGTNAAGVCVRYAYREVDPNCGAISALGKRLLCQISLAPVEKSCVERGPAGDSASSPR